MASFSITGATLGTVLAGTEIFLSDVMNSVKDEFHDFIYSEKIEPSNYLVQTFHDKCELGEPFKGMQSTGFKSTSSHVWDLVFYHKKSAFLYSFTFTRYSCSGLFLYRRCD